MKFNIILFAFAFIFSACSDNSSIFDDVNSLPVDTGGTYIPIAHETTTSPYGFYVYTPSGYSQNGTEFPLLIFLHGSGETGNSSSDIKVLNKILVTGIPKLINQKKWNPTYPMVVVTPQSHEGSWNATKVHNLIKYIIDTYKINTRRIYVTGLSMGGYGTYSYIQEFGDDSYAAAVVPICGGGNTSKASSFVNIPTWAFHGDADPTVNVSNSIKMIEAINALKPKTKALLTIYPGVGHDSWSRTYDETGMGQESSANDPFKVSIYDWMFGFKK